LTVAPRKFSGEKWPRNRSVEDAFDGKADAGAVESSGLTMESGALLGRSGVGPGEVQQLTVEGPGAQLAGGVIRFLADAQTALGLGQFGETDSAELRAVMSDETGTGALVFASSPLLDGPRIKGGTNYVTLVGEASGSPSVVTIPASNDIIALLNTAQTLNSKTLGSPSITGAQVTQTQNANAPTIFEVKNTDTGGSSYSILRLSNGSSNVDMLASHAGTLAQFAGGGSITLFQMVFDAFTWYSLGITHLARLTTAGLRIGPTASPATSMLTVEGSVALGKTQIITTTPATISATTTHVICDVASTATLTLPTASDFPDRVLWIRSISGNAVNSAGSNVAPLTGGSYGTAILSAAGGKWAMLVSDGGSGYQIQAAN